MLTLQYVQWKCHHRHSTTLPLYALIILQYVKFQKNTMYLVEITILALSWKSTICRFWGGTAGVQDQKELGFTHTTQMFECFVKRRGAWARPNQPKDSKSQLRWMNTQEEGLHTRHEFWNAFVKRRGAWGSPNQSLVTRRTNAREELTHTRYKC